MKGVVLLDGGMGQELIARSSRPATPLWSAEVMIHEPGIVRQVHDDYLAAGARVITLNSYSATPERFEKYGSPEMFAPVQAAAVEVARQAVSAAGGGVIAGCLSPLGWSYRPDRMPPEEEALAIYRRVVAAQSDAVDLFLCETMGSATEGRVAATAAAESGKPVWVAWTLRDEIPPDGAAPVLRSGEPLSEGIAAVAHLPVAAFLLNCSRPETIDAAIPVLAGAGKPWGAYANGFTAVEALGPGVTVDALSARADLDPEAYADFAMGWVDRGASIVGGCCEVGPAHIAAIAQRLAREGRSIVDPAAIADSGAIG